MANEDYKAAYERQRRAREKAEQLLEDRTGELHEAHGSLLQAYNRLKNQKAQLVHNEKLASIGQLAAGVAHEINTPAAYVKGNVLLTKRYFEMVLTAVCDYELLLKDCVAGKVTPEDISARQQAIKKTADLTYLAEDIPEMMADTLQGIERIENIVTSLKDFSRPDQAEAVMFDLNACVDNTLKVAWNQIKYKAELHTSFAELPEIPGQPGSLSQVFLNLLVNAAHAITDFGEIWVNTYVEKEFAVVEIIDNGDGIPEDIKTKIFDPFFTTKEVGKGTGLGLSITDSIIKKHGGRIGLESEVGKGTTFKVFLPLVRPD
ncbi:sensor histidine kinase [Teredinibacter waterburyi]|uniref:sensor histidine kinase n=1 Tax=Teredinibacter waterburyi TaxID=1500538 RepID=UPI00165EE061|nr:ATP-binding protein [Teredinibacter waterburyi]